MEIVFSLIGILLLTMVILPICTLVSIRGLVYEIEELKSLLREKKKSGSETDVVAKPRYR